MVLFFITSSSSPVQCACWECIFCWKCWHNVGRRCLLLCGVFSCVTWDPRPLGHIGDMGGFEGRQRAPSIGGCSGWSWWQTAGHSRGIFWLGTECWTLAWASWPWTVWRSWYFHSALECLPAKVEKLDCRTEFSPYRSSLSCTKKWLSKILE